jgi:hypothetical protein
MKFRSYNKEIHSCTAQFLDVFDNMIVERAVERDGRNYTTNIQVPCLYGPRSRVLKSLENKNKTVQLPIMTISLTSFSRDPDRAHSVNDVVNYQTSPTSLSLYHLTALPITLQYNMEIIAKYMSDLEQILTTFSVIMNPDIYVVFPGPHNIGNLKTQIIWNGSVDIENDESVDDRTPWRLTARTNFIVRTWLFPGTTPYDTSLEHRIKTINFHNNRDDN